VRSLDGETSAEDWANGFYGAMRQGLAHRKPLFKTFEDSAPLMAILVHFTDPDGVLIYGDAMKSFPQDALMEGWRVPEKPSASCSINARPSCAPPTKKHWHAPRSMR
jgi:hypothetical protein